MNIIDLLDRDKWYEYDEDQIFCGACMIDMVKKTQNGTFIDDEAVDPDLISEVKDPDEPMQCDECLTQNEAYEELGAEE
jgi:hypothetical protein